MDKQTKELIAKLEERIRQLEARPIYVPIYMQPQPAIPLQPWTPQPWESPWICKTGTAVAS